MVFHLTSDAQVLATLLLIFRVALGKAWTAQRSYEITTQIRFSSLLPVTSRRLGGEPGQGATLDSSVGAES